MPYKLKPFYYFEGHRSGPRTTISVFAEDRDALAALAEKHQVTRQIMLSKILDDYRVNERQREERASKKLKLHKH